MLLAAIAAAVFAVGYYAKRITAPPMQTSFPNAHLASLRTDLKRLDGQPTLKIADSVFNVTLHAARYFQREGLITMKESDDIIAKLTKQYTPYFLQSAKEHFSNNNWVTHRNLELRQRAKLLKGLRTQEDHKPILTGDIRASVDSVSNTITSYDEAQKLCKKTDFNSIENAKERIAQARSYVRMSNLRNCKELIDKLNSLPQRIEEAHYKQVERKVNKMAYYHYYSENDYKNDVAVDASNAIKEYRGHAYNLYGTQSSLDGLEQRYKNYWEAALEHFNRQHEDNSNSSW